MDELTKIGMPGLAGMLGIVLGWFGLKSRIVKIEKKVCDMRKELNTERKEFRLEVTCNKIHEAVNIRLQNIEEMHRECRTDLKEILRRLPK